MEQVQKSLISNGPEEKFSMGVQMGNEAVPGQIFCLEGDLGVGKTVFTQGFARGLGIEGIVNSPTFTILQIYEEGRLPLYHFDVYRIGDIEEMEEIGYEDCFFGEGVSLVEWPGRIEELIPKHALWITIRKEVSQGVDYREIFIGERKERE